MPEGAIRHSQYTVYGADSKERAAVKAETVRQVLDLLESARSFVVITAEEQDEDPSKVNCGVTSFTNSIDDPAMLTAMMKWAERAYEAHTGQPMPPMPEKETRKPDAELSPAVRNMLTALGLDPEKILLRFG